MNQFVQRLANYLANEVLIKGLAESRTFQRFALRTHTSIEELQAKGTQHVNAAMEELAKQQTAATAKAGQPPQPPLRGIPGFLSAFAKEVRKDFFAGK